MGGGRSTQQLISMKKFLLFVIISSSLLSLQAQEDILKELEKSTEKPREYALGVFKGNKIINGQSTEQPARNTINFIISHRFGRMSGGVKEFFGLDNANIRIGVEYGIINNLSIGLGRSSFEKTYDGYIKWRIIRQQTGKWNIPITISSFSSIAIKTADWQDPQRPNFFTSRMYYTFQMMFSRKFGQWVSLQLTPTLVHRNLVATVDDRNDVFALGFGSSVKITRRVKFMLEYFYVIPGQIVSYHNGEKVQNCLSVGLDIETGGHVFQLHFTNSRGMIEKHFVTETTGNWFPGSIKNFGVQFGFNITREFVIGKGKKPKEPKSPKGETGSSSK